MFYVSCNIQHLSVLVTHLKRGQSKQTTETIISWYEKLHPVKSGRLQHAECYDARFCYFLKIE